MRGGVELPCRACVAPSGGKWRLAACGTSHFAACYGAKIMRLLHSFDTIMSVDAGETTVLDLPQKDGGIIVVSQSGETKDVLRALDAGA